MSSKATMIACYPFDDTKAQGKDISGNGKDAVAMGTKAPQIEEVYGRKAAVLKGGEAGTSYFKLPENILESVSDANGLTVSTWVCGDTAANVWERIFDFGKGETGPYVFLTRFMRGDCFNSQDIAADAGKAIPNGEWTHVAMTVTGTQGGTQSSAGPRIYVNGELVADGKICPQKDAQGVTLTAVLSSQGKTRTKSFTVSVLPEDLPPYELTVHGDREVLKISDTLYGLFYEDINNAADGGIYAEMINNRSFENFTFDTYDARSGENGTSTGRNHEPLKFWFGDLDKVKVQNEGGLNAHFGIEDPDTAAYCIEVEPGTVLQNRGFCDNCLECSMNLKENESYHFTIWAKATTDCVVIW